MNKPLPRFRPPPLPTTLPAPFILVTLHAQHFDLDHEGLRKELVHLTGGLVSHDAESWTKFAEHHLLAVDGWTMLAKPSAWVAGAGKWFAFVVTGAKGEVHVYTGWSAPDGEKPSHTHLDLVRDSTNWMSRIVNAATPRWRWRTWPIRCGGYVSVAGRESGISVVNRQSLLQSALDKDAITTYAALSLLAAGAIAKAGDTSVRAVLGIVVAVAAVALAHTVARHFFILERYRWVIDGLER